MPFSILYVCTGNIHRSAFAERYTVHRLAQEAPSAAHLVDVHSAGIRGLEGHPLGAETEVDLARHGGVSTGFVARRLRAAHVERADLVLGMTREHRTVAVTEVSSALWRTFTLLEAADLIQLVGNPATDAPATGTAELVASMAAQRSAARIADYDVPDPVSQSAQVHAAVATMIAAAVDRVIVGLVPRLGMHPGEARD